MKVFKAFQFLQLCMSRRMSFLMRKAKRSEDIVSELSCLFCGIVFWNGVNQVFETSL